MAHSFRTRLGKERVVTWWKNFSVENFLDENDVAELKDLLSRCDEVLCARDHSLYDCVKYNVPSKEWNVPAFKKIIKRGTRHNKTLDACYFLKYPKYSFTRSHVDNPNKVQKTLITMIEESPDLIGGETLVWDRYYALPVKEGHHVRGTDGVQALHKVDEIICSPKLKPGETLIYDAMTKHAVTQVEQGHRIVLVTWYR